MAAFVSFTVFLILGLTALGLPAWLSALLVAALYGLLSIWKLQGGRRPAVRSRRVRA